MEKTKPKVDILRNVKQTKIQRMIERAINGDRPALKYLQVGIQYISYQNNNRFHG